MTELKPKNLKKCCYVQPPVRESMKLATTLDSLSDKNLKLDTDTVHKLSYQPVDTKQRLNPTWAMKPGYEKPTTPMDLKTIYANSYRLPGKFVECIEGAPNNLIVIYAENCNDIDGLTQVNGTHDS